MTEAEWLTCADAAAMAAFIEDETVSFRTRWHGWRTARRFPLGERKARLLAGAAASGSADLVRCVLGNPFRPPRLEPSWLAAHPHLVQVASAIDADGAFAELPVLGDALEEAGCADEEALAHCRGGPHARGCWVVDLVLGRG